MKGGGREIDVTDRVPPNVRFEVDDVEADWTYHQPFDYIHCRCLGGAIRDWPRLVRQCYEYVTALQNDFTPQLTQRSFAQKHQTGRLYRTDRPRRTLGIPRRFAQR